MALHLLLLPILLHTMVVSAQDDIPFNTTGFTEINVHQDDSSSRQHRFNIFGCNCKKFLSPGTSSVFTSPRFPNPYPSKRICQYFFQTDPSCNIQIECSFFQLPSFSNCCYTTNLYIKWGLQQNERNCFCGSSTSPSVVSSRNWTYAKFTSKWFNTRGYRGFNCTATSICPSSTSAPTTMTSAVPTTAAATTAAPTTAAPTTAVPTTAAPTTAPTTGAPTTVAPTTAAPTTASPTTVAATTAAPTTAAPTTAVPTTVVATATTTP